MEKSVLVISILFFGWISLTDSHTKDDRERLQKLDDDFVDQNRKLDIWKDIRRLLSPNNNMRSDGRELLKKNGIRKKVLETKHTSQDVSGRNNYAKTSEHQTDKEDQIRALEAFLQADRRKMKDRTMHQRDGWIVHDLNQKGQNNTSSTSPNTPQTPPQTTSAPKISWCRRSWWWCRRRR